MSRLGLALAIPVSPHAELLQILEESRRRGLDSFWLTEGVNKDALVQLAALAPHSEGIKLGTAIVNIYSRSPAVLAMAAATLDDISGGRFILGLGSGHSPRIEGSHGIPFEQPVERMRDYVIIIRKALAGQRVTHKGEAYRVQNLQIGFAAPSGRVPIYLAVLGVGMARLAGEMADGVILHLTTVEQVARVKQAIAEGAAAAGRDPSEIEVACFIMCSASPDQSYAHQEATRAIARYGAMRFYRNLLRHSGFRQEADGLRKAWSNNDPAAAAGYVSEAMLHSLSISAGPKETQDKVDAFRNAGVDLPLLFPIVSPEARTRPIHEALEAVPAGT